MPDQSINNYIDYLRHQATTHPDILHDDAPGSNAFDIITWDAIKGNLSETLGGFRTRNKEKSVVLLAVVYTFSATGDSFEGTQDTLCAYIVAKYNSSRENSPSAIISAMTDAERIGLDIAKKITRDSLNGHPFFYFTANDLESIDLRGQPLLMTGDGSYAGWLFTFRKSNRLSLCASDVEWTDGGLTPYE